MGDKATHNAKNDVTFEKIIGALEYMEDKYRTGSRTQRAVRVFITHLKGEIKTALHVKDKEIGCLKERLTQHEGGALLGNAGDLYYHDDEWECCYHDISDYAVDVPDEEITRIGVLQRRQYKWLLNGELYDTENKARQALNSVDI